MIKIQQKPFLERKCLNGNIKRKKYTLDDIYKLPEGKRAELIDGYIYDMAPFAVFLDENDKTYVEPDISVVCDEDKLDERGCNGAPDFIIEIVSPGST